MRIFILMLAVFALSCNRLVVSESELDRETNSTGHINYLRNAVAGDELKPPLNLVYEDDMIGLPAQGYVYANQRLFFSTTNGYVQIFNLKKMDTERRKKLGLSSSAPPTIYQNILFSTFETGKYGMIAVDLNNSDQLWEIKGRFSKSSVIVQNKIAVFISQNGQITAHNFLSGEKIWEYFINDRIENSAAVFEGNLIISTISGSVISIDISSGIRLWMRNLKSAFFAEPVINKEKIFLLAYSGNFYIIDSKSGNIIHEKKYDFAFYHAPVVQGNLVYIPYSDGRLKCYDFENKIDLWLFSGEGPAAESPLVTRNYIYFPTLDKFLYVIDKHTGEKIQEIKLNGRPRSIPLIAENRLVISLEDKQLNVFTASN